MVSQLHELGRDWHELSCSESTVTDPSSSGPRANDLPEPEQTGTEPGSQKPGSPDITVLPPATHEGGLYQTNVSEMLLAAQGQNFIQIAKLAGTGIDHFVERLQKKVDELQKELRDAHVDLARTEQQLRNALLQNGKNVFLVGFGGAVLGYGLNDFDHSPGKLFSAIGIILLVIGSLPFWPGKIK